MHVKKLVPLALAAALLVASAAHSPAAAQESPPEARVYVLDVPLGPVCVDGTFPVEVASGDAVLGGDAVLTTAATGEVTGTLTLGTDEFAVTGGVKHAATSSLRLVAKRGKDVLKLRGTFADGRFAGGVSGKGAVAPGKGTFVLDATAGRPQAARVVARLVPGKGTRLGGEATATVCGAPLDLRVTGSVKGRTEFALRARGFRLDAWGTEAAGLFDLSWRASGYGGSGRGGPVTVARLAPPSGLAYAQPAALYEEGVAIAPNALVAGIAPLAQYAVDPPLPDGLALNPSTGTLTGTPTLAAPETQHTVTATNLAGSAAAHLTITVRISRAKSFAVETRPLADADLRHLLTRTHWGVRQKDLDRIAAVGLPQFLDEMLVFPTGTAAEQSAFAELVNTSDPPALQGGFPSSTQCARWWERLMMETDAPFQETLAFFWHDHFGVSVSVLNYGYYMVDHVNLLRRQGNGNLRDLMLAVARDPAMLVFLNGTQNTRTAPNENFAREFWELFTLGVDNGYTQDDIKVAARAWTGYRERYDATVGRNYVTFDYGRHDVAAKTFFGQTIPAQAASVPDPANPAHDNFAAVVDITLQNRPVAEYVTRKLFESFGYADPPQVLVDEMAADLRSRNYELAPFLKRLFQSEAFFSPAARSALVKSPLEFSVGFLRSTGLYVTPSSLNTSLASMTQQPCMPPTVNGWPTGDLWVFGAGMLDRINFVNVCVEDTVRQASVGIDVAAILPPVAQRTADAVVDALATRMRIALSDAERQQMVTYLNSQRQTNGTVVASPFDGSSQQHLDERVRGLIYVLAQHPGYQAR